MSRARGVAILLAATLLAPPAGAANGPRPFGWSRLTGGDVPRTEVAAAAGADGRIVVAGGFAPPGETVASVEIYDPATDSWSEGPPLPLAVNHAMATSLDGEVYVLGGATSGGPATDQAYVLRSGAWQPIAPMPEPRTAGGAATADGRIHVVGGIGPSGLAQTTMVYDPLTGWTIAAGLRRPREHLGVTAWGGRVFAVGGRTGSTNHADTEVFDPSTGAWRRLPDMPTRRGGLAAAATPSGVLVAPGGEIPATFEEVEALDLRRERWVSLAPMPTPRHGLGVVAIGDLVYTLHGGPQAGLAFSSAAERIRVRRLDRVRCLGRPATLIGSPGSDTLAGGPRRDVMVGLGGRDRMKGRGGRDLLCGRAGNDRLAGGPGNDAAHGGSGTDRCHAETARSCERRILTRRA